MNSFKCSIFIAAISLAGTSLFAQTDTKVRVEDNGTVISSPVSQEAYALPWVPIAEKDILWKRRVWRDVDLSEGTALATILLDGIAKGNIKGYTAADDRFTTLMGKGDVQKAVTRTTKFRIKEDWLFLAKENKMVVRIVGIAPISDIASADGTVTPQPAFWVFYPDTRNYLAQYKADKEKSWDELLFLMQNKG